VSGAVKRVAIVARLRPGSQERARDLLSEGPPYDVAEGGFDRHTVFVSESEVVFVFEGDEVEWKLDDLVSDFFRARLQEAFEQWKDLVEGEPQLAEEAYFWDRRPSRDDAGSSA
jgi:hypothetical protein